MRKRAVYIMCICTLASLSLCGCGVQQKAEDSKEKVSLEETVQEGASLFMNGKTTVKKHCLENDYIRLWFSFTEEDEEYGWCQVNLDGTGQMPVDEKIISENTDVFWLTNEWVYCFECDRDKSGGTMYRIPFKYEKTPMYDPEKKESLFHISGNYDVFGPEESFVTDDYIFLADQEKYYRYDFRTGEVKESDKSTGTCYMVFDDSMDMPVVLEDCFFIIDDAGLYRVSIDSLEKNRIYSYKGMSAEPVSAMCTGDSIYFAVEDDDIMQYHMNEREASVLIKRKDFQKQVESMGLADDDALEQWIDVDTNSMTVWNDRLYVAVFVGWNYMGELAEGDRKGEQIENSVMREVLLSADLNDVSQWVLEVSFSDFIIENSEPDLYYDSPDGYVKFAKKKTVATMDIPKISRIFNGKVYFELEYAQKGKNGYYSYDLDTKKIQPIEKSSYEYDMI